jgi:outer membrane receptor for Fe3+-dicitrate
MYHLFFQRNKSFSMFHLNDELKSTFSRLLFDTTSLFFFELKRFTFSFFLSCFIDAFSTKNRIRCVNESDCCKINNTMRNFKNEMLNVVFLLKTFFIQSFETRSSLFATFSSRSFFEIFSMFRNDDLKKKNFQNSFHNRNDFFFQEVLCVFND